MVHLVAGTFVVLILQYYLGMTVNLFVVIPDDHPGINSTSFSDGSCQAFGWVFGTPGLGVLQAHIIIGLLLVAVSFGTLVLAVIAMDWRWIGISLLTFAFIFGAMWGGILFLVNNNDCFSMMMAGFWGLSVALVAVGLIFHGSLFKRVKPYDDAIESTNQNK